MIKMVNTLFPIWAILFSIVAYFQPHLLVDLKTWIVPLLILIMFCMGITLTVDDFKRALKNPKVIALTVALQFLIMPLSAYLISKIMGFSLELTVGMVLVGAVSGGTASNVIAYLAKADVALSITMTIVSTLLSVLVTPYLTLLYVGQSIPVPVESMLLSILKIVLIPVLLGTIINHFFKKYIETKYDIFAFLSIASIVFVIGIVVSLNHQRISSVGMIVVIGIMLHNMIGIVGGYFLAKFFGYNRKVCKTVAIEVGMQNSGLAVALAFKYFTPLSALPGALFSIWHNISGSIVAWYWSKKR